jgi:hypothetical protein
MFDRFYLDSYLGVAATRGCINASGATALSLDAQFRSKRVLAKFKNKKRVLARGYFYEAEVEDQDQ